MSALVRLIVVSSFLEDMVTNLQVHIREGVQEMLELVSEFCNIYVYSHGIKSYILEVLKVLDPEEKYIKEREKRVIAPED